MNFYQAFCWMISWITNPANMNPKIAVVWAMVPFVWTLALCQSCSARSSVVSWNVSCPLFVNNSSLYTHLNFLAGKFLFFLNFCRRAFASGQPFTFQNSAMFIFKGSILRAAPIEEKSLPGLLHARWINKTYLPVASFFLHYPQIKPLWRLVLTSCSKLMIVLW